jgi:homospermidine synthase
MTSDTHPIYGNITGPIVMIGFGSVGRGTLPLIERHFEFDRSRVSVIDPVADHRGLVDERGFSFVQAALTEKNYEEILTPLLTAGGGRGFCINLSVDVGSVDILHLCRKLGALYVDTVIEPWLGFYFDDALSNGERTNFALRKTLLKERKRHPGGSTAVSCCGANPGMVSWLVKQALLDIARETGVETEEPATNDRHAWAKLMKKVGVKGIHVAERDTQRARSPKPFGVFWNTWSVEGFISEGMQPAELGWGTHETWKPKNARGHKKDDGLGLYLEQPGGDTRVRSWCPTHGAQFGLLVTHNEALSISDYYTVRDKHDAVVYRPTCHYAYHPCNDAIISLNELFGASGRIQPLHHVLSEGEILDGGDELGVLLYGHDRNAYWYGSQLTVEQARQLAPHQNATGLQVSSAVLAGMVWAIENPEAGIVEADEMDFRRCLEIQRPYLGTVAGHYTDWTPLQDRPGLFDEDIDRKDPWQFRNILVR